MTNRVSDSRSISWELFGNLSVFIRFLIFIVLLCKGRDKKDWKSQARLEEPSINITSYSIFDRMSHPKMVRSSLWFAMDLRGSLISRTGCNHHIGLCLSVLPWLFLELAKQVHLCALSWYFSDIISYLSEIDLRFYPGGLSNEWPPLQEKSLCDLNSLKPKTGYRICAVLYCLP